MSSVVAFQEPVHVCSHILLLLASHRLTSKKHVKQHLGWKERGEFPVIFHYPRAMLFFWTAHPLTWQFLDEVDQELHLLQERPHTHIFEVFVFSANEKDKGRRWACVFSTLPCLLPQDLSSGFYWTCVVSTPWTHSSAALAVIYSFVAFGLK